MMFMAFPVVVRCQDETTIRDKQKEEKEEHGMQGTHRLTFEMAHTHVFEGKDIDGNRKWLVLPSLSLNYDYRIADKWALGIYTDLIAETFVIEKEDGTELERTNPFSLLGTGVFKPGKHSSFLVGAGVEFSKEKNLFVNRIGYEWGAEINKHWEVSGSFAYDIRWNAFDSYTIGLGVSYLLTKKGHKDHTME
jgi:hypothetical protein